MERKNRNWLYLVPVAGAVFCLWYLYTSFYDVVYSDYIRLVNSYLPDVWTREILGAGSFDQSSGKFPGPHHQHHVFPLQHPV